MPARIRLQRFGRKKRPFFHIVIADSRAPRDGKIIEKIGTYNSLTIPATIDLDFDKALKWLNKGAQPSDTVRAILSYKGILYKNHLNKGIKKGALTEEQAEAKFKKWLIEKESKINSVASENKLKIENIEKKRLEAEKIINEQRYSAIAKKIEKENLKKEEIEVEDKVADKTEVKTEVESKEQQEPVKTEDIKTEQPKAEKQEPVKTEDIKTEVVKQKVDKKTEQPKTEKQEPVKTEVVKQKVDKKIEQPKAEKQEPVKTEDIKTKVVKKKVDKKIEQPKAEKQEPVKTEVVKKKVNKKIEQPKAEKSK